MNLQWLKMDTFIIMMVVNIVKSITCPFSIKIIKHLDAMKMMNRQKIKLIVKY